jgi:hypothetical protein
MNKGVGMNAGRRLRYGLPGDIFFGFDVVYG